MAQARGQQSAAQPGGQQSADQLSRVLTKEQVAGWLQVRPRQLDVLRVPCLNLGHKTKRFLAADVQAWLEAQRRPVRRAA